jgi:small subunit ribosomal protein S20
MPPGLFQFNQRSVGEMGENQRDLLALWLSVVIIFPLLLEEEVKSVPNKKSAAKRVLIAEKNRLYNRYWKTRCKTTAKNFLAALSGGDVEAVAKSLDEAQSALDKAVVKGVIHRNTAARRKSNMALKASALAKTN